MEEVWTVVQCYGSQSILKTGLNRPLNWESSWGSKSRIDGRSVSKICSRCDENAEWRKTISKGLYSIVEVDWLIAVGTNISSTTALRFADREGLPSNNTMGSVSARPLQDVRMNHSEQNRQERPGRF